MILGRHVDQFFSNSIGMLHQMVSPCTALKTTHSWIFYINSVIKFNLNYFFNSLYFFKLLSVTSVICVFVLSDNLSAKGIHFFFCTMLIFRILFYIYMENKKIYKICDIKYGIRFLFHEIFCLKL